MKKRIRFKIILGFKGILKFFLVIYNSLFIALKAIHSFFKQNISFIVIPHVKGNVKILKFLFDFIFLFLLFLGGFIGFVLLAVNYVTLSSIVKSTEKNYSLAESEIEDFRNTVVEINSVAKNFSKVLDELKTSLKINSNGVDLNKNKLDGDLSDFIDLQILEANSIKELSDLKILKAK